MLWNVCIKNNSIELNHRSTIILTGIPGKGTVVAVVTLKGVRYIKYSHMATRLCG